MFDVVVQNCFQYVCASVLNTQSPNFHPFVFQLHYISPNIGSAYGTAQSATSVFGYIGTPAQLRCKANLVWKQGPCVLIEEALSPAVVEKIYTLGPNYVGCLQSVSSASTQQSQSGILDYALNIILMCNPRNMSQKHSKCCHDIPNN